MEKINKYKLRDKLITILIILSLLILIVHLISQQDITFNNADSNHNPQTLTVDSLVESTDSIWENTEFMQH